MNYWGGNLNQNLDSLIFNKSLFTKLGYTATNNDSAEKIFVALLSLLLNETKGSIINENNLALVDEVGELIVYDNSSGIAVTADIWGSSIVIENGIFLSLDTFLIQFKIPQDITQIISLSPNRY